MHLKGIRDLKYWTTQALGENTVVKNKILNRIKFRYSDKLIANGMQTTMTTEMW